MTETQEVDLKVTVNDQAAAALESLVASMGRVAASEKQLAGETKKLQDAQAKLEEQKKAIAADKERAKRTPTMGDRASQGAGMLGQMVKGGGGAGGLGAVLGKLGPYGAAAAAALGAVDTAANRAADTMNILNNGALTNAQKREMLLSEYVPLYKSLKNFREAIDGTTEGVRKAKYKMEMGAAQVQAQYLGINKMRDVEHPYQEAVGIKGAWNWFKTPVAPWQDTTGLPGAGGPAAGGAPAPGAGGAPPAPGGAPGPPPPVLAWPASNPEYDRATARGSRKQAELDITLPAQDERRRAGVQAMGIKEAYTTQRGEAGMAKARATKKFEESQTAQAELEAKLKKENRPGAPRDKKGIAEAIAKADTARRESAEAQKQAETEINRLKDAGLKYAQAEHQVRQANVAVAKAELDMLKQKEDRMAGFSQKLGSMNEVDFEYAKEMLKTVQQEGIENLPAEYADAASQVAPEYIAKQREALGAKRAGGLAKEFKGIDDSQIGDFETTTLQEVREKVDKVKADIRVNIDLDAKQLANETANILGPIISDIKVVVERQQKEIIDTMRQQQIQKTQAEG